MTDSAEQRRERYAAALCEADGHNWAEIRAHYQVDVIEYYREADAATAVADAEITERLRAEVRELAHAGFAQAAGFLDGGIDD